MRIEIINKTSHSLSDSQTQVNETSQNQNHQKKINETSHKTTSGQYGGKKRLKRMKQISLTISKLTKYQNHKVLKKKITR